jgi:superfamily II DNA or RNA helicase
MTLPDWPNHIDLREWQKQAIELYNDLNQNDFLAVATPAAGKTIFALYLAHNLLQKGDVKKIVIVSPSNRLRTQWTEKSSQVGIELSSDFTKEIGHIVVPSDFLGLVTTYQEVSVSKGEPFRSYCKSKPTFVIFDEIHHCGDELSWGDSIKNGFGLAYSRLLLSGTPFRSDDKPIPFVRYDEDGVLRKSHADYNYGYGDALQDEGVCRYVVFPTYNGEMTWSYDFEIKKATFEDELLNDQEAKHRLDTALSPNGDWLKTVLEKADQKIQKIRTKAEASHPNAGGLVITKDDNHARQIVTLLENITAEKPALATHKEEDAASVIANFEHSNQRWIVAVKMVSEGVDIPRLRVGVYATNIQTELFFRQALGRIIRWVPSVKSQEAWFYAPKIDPLLSYIEQIKEERDHVLADDNDDSIDNSSTDVGMGERQQSFYTPISSIAIEGGEWLDGEYFPPDEIEKARMIKQELGTSFKDDPETKIAKMARMFQAANSQSVASLPVSESNTIPVQPSISTTKQVTKQERVKKLRQVVKKRVTRLMYLLNEKCGEDVDQRFINIQWIRQGGKKANEATEEDLKKKIAWLDAQINQAKNKTWQGWV